MKYLIVGLGNPGIEYKYTRHNIGWQVIDHIVEEKSLDEKIERLAIYSYFQYRSRVIHMIRPTTYMNLSGKSVRYWVDKLKVKIENILILTDDIALPYGKLRLRPKGSSGGHNGLQSIEECLNTSKYPRLKIGIGDDFSRGKQSDFVLGRFDEEESSHLPHIYDECSKIIQHFCFHGIQHTMNSYNK